MSPLTSTGMTALINGVDNTEEFFNGISTNNNSKMINSTLNFEINNYLLLLNINVSIVYKI